MGAVIAVRPDLVYGARGLTAPLKLRVGGELVDAPAVRARTAARRAGSTRKVWGIGLVTALVLAGFVSFYASASPDGLEKVAHDKGIDAKTNQHATADSPLADYGVKDIARRPALRRPRRGDRRRRRRSPWAAACSGRSAGAVREPAPDRTPEAV